MGSQLKIETLPISKLQPDVANLRRHPERNLAAIRASLARFGQQRPIVIDGNGVVRAGNGTLEAARQLGWDRIDVVRSDLSGTEATAYAIADNRTAELAEWSNEDLAGTLRSLQSEGFDLDAVGFTSDEVDAMVEGMADELLPPEADGREYDESIEDEVEYCECPKCSHRWPK